MRKSEVPKGAGVTYKAAENLVRTINALSETPEIITPYTFETLCNDINEDYARKADVIKSVTRFLNNNLAVDNAAEKHKSNSFPDFLNNAIGMVGEFAGQKYYDTQNNGTVMNFIKAALRADSFEYPELIAAQQNAVEIFSDFPGYDEHKDRILDDIIKNDLFDFISIPLEVRGKALSVLEKVSCGNPELQMDNVISYTCYNYDCEDKNEREFRRAMFRSMVKPFFNNVENKKLDDDNTALKLMVSKFGDKEFGGWALNKAVSWSFDKEPNTSWERQYVVDRMISAARNAGKNHSVHNALKDITKSQPELVRERVVNYIEHGVMNGMLTLTDAYKEKGMAFLLDNKADVLNRVEKFILSVSYNSKAHRIFSDYRTGIAELSGNSDGKQHVSPNNKISNPLNF